MSALHLSYLELLNELSANLDQLGRLAQEKAGFVRQNDLMGLDEVLKQEQAMTLTLRGLEQKRQKLLSQLGLADVPLSELPGQCPEELEPQARRTVETLRQSYAVYRSYADAARSTLELNLHEIEKVIAASGVDPKLAAAGYETPSAEPPEKMKTDFRA